ncbi:predicted protein [Sclerotinia sclerotiorum 1980 UF-70]|uniref:Uncharacterized protein n=1 Tax=Sclerotinia sclerotiorum (strain ATCC 18683 / 1980 / Ss-1) TaxID=665079 RepID=A7EFV7_SCLS1|nr:predicted protein [Sclerotinia sclerotiorum 1980 UF-70]EDO01723.1 predicted protein [Sclerotinia sclerotiorum 1980 UF-70]
MEQRDAGHGERPHAKSVTIYYHQMIISLNLVRGNKNRKIQSCEKELMRNLRGAEINLDLSFY